MNVARLICCAMYLCAASAAADTVIAARTIRAQEIISASDLRLIEENVPGMAARVEAIAGQEARRILYTGRPIAISDVGPPALVDRNQIVSLAFRVSGLTIVTDGRSLSRGGVGDRVRVLNLTSRATVSGKIGKNGTVWVGE